MKEGRGRREVHSIPHLGVLFEISHAGSRPASSYTDASEVWHGVDGAVGAKSYILDGCAWIDVSRVGIFRFDIASRKIIAFPEPTTSTDLVHDTYLRVVLPIGLSYCGYEVLHASATLTEKGVIGFCAVSGTGKSTLAAALARKGYAAFADDALVLDFDAQPPAVTAVPVPFSLRLKEDSAPGSMQPGTRQGASPRPLVALYLLEREPLPPSPPQLVRLAPTAAFSALLPHTYHASLDDPARNRPILARYVQLVARVPVYRLTFAPDFSSLPRLVHVVEESIAAGDRGATPASTTPFHSPTTQPR